ncbi:hypothetical protein AKJ09_05079 [Labilithrix luteola]|uniref:Integral membrane protein n=1 Tax=Labilithrix luteola TaxID=1391654 RepID=A0A0K1PY08_9BACT|nr:hypothetical protein [Labilithrix luteola]AKU98415.1 hypothetical protein AKJ09_05079 [Labilithrix luteola]
MTTFAPIAISPQGSTLRRVLAVDAATCAGMGALLTAATRPLAGLLGLPSDLLFWSGVSLFPIAVLMGRIATRPAMPRAGVGFVIAGNVGWVVGSAVVLFATSPSALGYAFVLAQAAVVGILAELEYVGLRKAG